jgi:hypothetical protein
MADAQREDRRPAWQDTGFISSFENRGLAVRVEEGGKASADVKVIER